MSITTDFALLAPVPQIHLTNALAENLPLVAFGSNAWEVFRKLEEERVSSGLRVDIFLYASLSDTGKVFHPQVTWRGCYVKCVDATSASGRREAFSYRPSSTKSEKGWAIYWLVKDLEELPESQYIKVSALRGWKTKSTYSPNFIPEGPLLIDHPRV